jgi:flagellar protein FlbT
MPLKIDLKPGEKFVLNGAVVSVGRDGRSLLLQNEAILMREKDIMQEDEANTPARRIYFTIMLMYIDSANKAAYEKQYQKLMIDLAQALAPLPQTQQELIQVIQDVAGGQYYQAMRKCRKLFEIEDGLLSREQKKDDR